MASLTSCSLSSSAWISSSVDFQEERSAVGEAAEAEAEAEEERAARRAYEGFTSGPLQLPRLPPQLLPAGLLQLQRRRRRRVVRRPHAVHHRRPLPPPRPIRFGPPCSRDLMSWEEDLGFRRRGGWRGEGLRGERRLGAWQIWLFPVLNATPSVS
ncbi:hypothetical protein ZWY2020_016201 [Hordeum vulgare]|nr:hypothetical protein ZWY2020_016201 [Hordeum vulgare]